MMDNMGDLTLIEVYNWGGSGTDVEPITDKVVEGFSAIEGVRVATPLYQPQYLRMNFVSGVNDKFVLDGYNIKAMNKDAIEAYGYELSEGRFPQHSDKEYTVLMGELTAYQFQNSKKQWPHNIVEQTPDENGDLPKPFLDVMKDKIKIKTLPQDPTKEVKQIEKPIHVVGKLKQDTSKGYETLYGVIMDLNDVLALEKEYMKVNNIKDTSSKKKERVYQQAIVKVKEVKDVDAVDKAIKDLGYQTYSSASFRNEMKKQTQIMQLILGGLGSISLLVAAIGIANTMTMAIYERTKEIGVMKVLGCELKDIKNMFLAEAAGIGFLGGIIGIVVCLVLSKVLNMIGGSMISGGGPGAAPAISIIPLWLIGFGISFSTLIGIISGYLPTVRAVKITALSAIRHE
ncbi:MAG: ABC transporter permease [Oscillospiraceae bacterium]